ncbi:MAG: hypothetical protein QNJ54_33525 [Prochloraceae cyanobacterium]|nr:hypothetical protein [Prochloraceae cyanobacterium]
MRLVWFVGGAQARLCRRRAVLRHSLGFSMAAIVNETLGALVLKAIKLLGLV